MTEKHGTAQRYAKRLAIIVPYRDREDHLTRFIPHMKKYFERDKLDRHIRYSLHVVEQAGDDEFNRGMMRNCGVDITKDAADYFCFHDVDYLPIWADYSFPERPSCIIKHGFNPGTWHDAFFGAVVLISKEDFFKTNGYSNGYWGWGFEDEELRERCRAVGLSPARREGTFNALPHPHHGRENDGTYSETGKRNLERYRKRSANLSAHMENDGFNSLSYEVLKSTKYVLNDETLINVYHHTIAITP